MARVGIFVDVSNLYYCVKLKYSRKINYLKYRDFVSTDRTTQKPYEIVRANAYGAQRGVEANSFLSQLRSFGYEPKYKRPKCFENPNYKIEIDAIENILKQPNLKQIINKESLAKALAVYEEVHRVLKSKMEIAKADWDVGIAVDIMRIINRVDILVLGSADGDLAPVIEWAKEQQCKTIVCACNISRELREVADEIFEIDEFFLE